MDQLIRDEVFAVIGVQTAVCSVYASEAAARRIVERFNADPFIEPGTPDPDAPYRVEARTRESIGNWHVHSDAEADADERHHAANHPKPHATVPDLPALAELHKALDHLTEAWHLALPGLPLEAQISRIQNQLRALLGE